ncbi:hypothetical protein SASPL_110088 [Salvia splendens]|uniref:Uncharacterized protein n=1 Tax=Salvia splendens TaxID=180675 RepID=A0A8X8Y415_SALSN|nr:hypothetical protein SASPL_110088 [Salvia splendens]
MKIEVEQATPTTFTSGSVIPTGIGPREWHRCRIEEARGRHKEALMHAVPTGSGGRCTFNYVPTVTATGIVPVPARSKGIVDYVGTCNIPYTYTQQAIDGGVVSSSLILPEMKSIGYTPDCGTSNYLFLTLSKIGQFGIGRAGCVPDYDSYGGLIAELSEARKVDVVAEVVREMM